MRKLLITYSIVLLPFLISAQGTFIPMGSEEKDYLQRLEIGRTRSTLLGYHTA